MRRTITQKLLFCRYKCNTTKQRQKWRKLCTYAYYNHNRYHKKKKSYNVRHIYCVVGHISCMIQVKTGLLGCK